MKESFHHIHAVCCSFQLTGLDFDVHMSIFVSPIVFPLAFSINGKLCTYQCNAVGGGGGAGGCYGVHLRTKII